MKFRFFLIVFTLIQTTIYSQYKVSGTVVSDENKTLNKVEIYNESGGLLAETNTLGAFSFSINTKTVSLVFYADNYKVKRVVLKVDNYTDIKIVLDSFSEELSEIEIKSRKRKVFELKRLKDVEGTAIYAGKKTEVVLVNQSAAALSTNNARQIFNQVAGLNIYQNDDAGLQLNIGGRGLDPNRTANFNTRQNGYDISADVLGYPESYYTPASEGLDEIQVIRGAASLQYGTQFGGLVNFITKKPTKNQEIVFRNTLGSYGLYTNFTSLSNTYGKFSYYAYINYKKGDGFRPNSEFESTNIFAHLGYQINNKSKLSLELTGLKYLAQQAGGLTDDMFNEEPLQSNRARNWFQVEWFLYNLKWEHAFSDNTNFSFNFFGLDASRDALGFRTNRVNQVDSGEERDLIKGTFKNFGFESRLVNNYTIFDKKSTFLIGTKFYKAKNTNMQGPGSDGSDADFNMYLDEYPDYANQSDSKFPNLNTCLFGENIFYINDKLSITPGFRLEYINTKRDEIIKDIVTDAAGNVINENLRDEEETNERTFVLLGLGSSYKLNKTTEFYGNISQNYRSVTFSDISTANPAFEISPDITDEKGFTIDAGFRGNYKNFFSYDANVFGLFYNDRINIYTRDDGKAERDNIGDARILGIESLIDFNLKKLFINNSNYVLNYFINSSFITSEYTKSEINGVVGNQVEFIPNINIKTGARFGYKDFLASIQYSYLSRQFSDATNATGGSISGVTGEIPAYDILDVSASYKYKFLKIETGVNNLLDNSYFTRRATGYPGPGIIPSSPRNYYITLEFKF
ncbi:TonB-dependent receptor family protein [Polaribacter sargassicola]|uniref:TonB-dependent receptor family protein n=1 Tax=Polaribacter sargassicola TaxID=2836891 RepID=UPI001F2569C1|nr:TonB-dependent receptor plug domain-containing protein [Polaribacter sp. DS7-9]MCG1037034.1 TonB-dependent receptor plug domain-containing protein [Polaribacter sp. DS7-9]